MEKPILFMDVDGVLFGDYAGERQLRPNAVGFLRWCMRHFEVQWLTSWTHNALRGLFTNMYARDIADDIPYTNWDGLDSKVDAVNLAANFYWVEDGPMDPNVTSMQDRHGHSRFIEAKISGSDELFEIEKSLHLRLVAYLRDAFDAIQCNIPESFETLITPKQPGVYADGMLTLFEFRHVRSRTPVQITYFPQKKTYEWRLATHWDKPYETFKVSKTFDDLYHDLPDLPKILRTLNL